MVDKNTNNKNKEEDIVYGIVEEALPNAMFRVSVKKDNDTTLVLSYLSGRMRRFKIRVLVGDKVGMIMDKYGGKSRIVKRV